MDYLLAFLSGYLLGSISFALLFARLRGINLREIGSGNLGATNAGRALGRKTGVLVFLLDAAKGALPAWAWLFFGTRPELAVLAGLGAYLGHIWPIYLRFRGGKGVATLVGALLVLAPISLLWALLAPVISILATRIMAVGSMALGIALPLAAWWRQEPAEILWFMLGAGLFLFYTHRSNIARLLAGTEKKLGSGAVDQPDSAAPDNPADASPSPTSNPINHDANR
jgi:acyl phosphate:glycerol-3-phosphate acyltransferase